MVCMGECLADALRTAMFEQAKAREAYSVSPALASLATSLTHNALISAGALQHRRR